jgi:tRNA dimethylallyltransferase
VIRALAVLNATGRSLASYQDEAQRGLLDGFTFERLVLNPDRELLRQRIARRFETMFSGGAVEEVEAVLALAARSQPAGDEGDRGAGNRGDAGRGARTG